MSGAFVAAKQASYRVELGHQCCFMPLNGRRCVTIAMNAVQCGHDGDGCPYNSYYCDEHDKERM